MFISATIKNKHLENDVTVATESNSKRLSIPGKPEGYGSSVNGGELLFLSLAICFCNDVYREAARRKIAIHSVDVTVSGEFGNEGDPASNIMYDVHIQSNAPQQAIQELIHHVDKIAEVHNTLRKGVSVSLKSSTNQVIK